MSAGTLQLSGAGTLGSTAGVTTVSGGTLDLGGTTQTQAAVNLSGGTLQNGALNAPISSAGGTINGIGGTASVTTAAGTTIVEGNNTYTGATTVNGGTLAAGGVNLFSPNSNTVVNSGGTLNLESFNQTLNNGLTNAGTVQLPASPGISAPGTILTVGRANHGERHLAGECYQRCHDGTRCLYA